MTHSMCYTALFVTLFSLWLGTSTVQAAPATQKQSSSAKQPTQEQVHRHYIRVMRQELNRNLKQFKTMKHPRVYHLRYKMRIYRTASVAATDGHITGASNNFKSPSKLLRVDLRVGNHTFDNTGRDGRDWKIYRSLLGASGYCPKELTPFAMQKILWKLTERKYRIAVGTYWRKQYVRSIQPKILDKAGDLSKESPTVYMAPLKPKVGLNNKKWKSIAQRISALSRKAPNVIHSSFSLNLTEEIILGVGSDGSQVRLRKWGYTWSMSISYLGKSKELLTLSDSGYARKESELPNESTLKNKFLSLWKNAKQQLAAKEGVPDEGPAIVDPALAGAIFYDILMVRLESGRFLRKRDPRTFAEQLNKPIIPSFLSVIDNPLLRYWGSIPLSSHYMFDDEWVPAKRMVMIKNGVLKNFYTSRKPYKQLKQSNGHGRGAFSYAAFSRPGVTIVQSQRALDAKTLRARLVQEIKRQGKRYGYILKRFRGYSQVRRSIYSVTPEQIYRLDIQTNTLTQLKGLQVRTGALQVIRGILATGKDYSVFNGSDSESSGPIQISTVVPSLLLKRLSFHRINLPEKKMYELPAPFKARTLKSVAPTPKQAKPKTCPKTCPKVCKCAVCK